MSSRAHRHSTTDLSLLPVPHVLGAAVLAGAAFSLLLGALRAIGGKQPAWHASWPEPMASVAEWVMQCLNGVARVVAGGQNGASLSQRLGCLLLLIAFFVLLRRAMLSRNAYKPGPVDVKRLVASSPDVETQVEGLTAQLRKYLSETNLYPPTALPAEAPADNFLDLLGDVDLEPKKLGTSLLRLFSRLRPTIAYTVRGVLRARAQEPHLGVTITVTSYAIRGSRTETLWETTWEDVVREAGNWVMATLVPVTRASRRPPWQDWHGRDLCPDLFAAYQEARRLTEERKFDDALEHYYAALRLDPMNLYLRTQIAGTQEKLGLHLDALETYYGAMLLDGCTNRQRKARLARKAWNPRRFLRHRYRWWRDGLLEARYRYAVVLGVTERTAAQWCRSPFEDTFEPRRAQAREEIRRSLTPAFVDRYWPTLIGLTPPGRSRFEAEDEVLIKDWLARQLGDHSRREIVRMIFQCAAQEEMRQLARDYPLVSLHPFAAARRRGTVTWPSLRLNRDVWAPLRLAWADGVCESGCASGTECVRHRIDGLPKAPDWLAQPETLEEQVRKVMAWPLPDRLKQWARDWSLWPRRPWQDSYSAACVYAVAMHVKARKMNADDLAEMAVNELEDAARTDRSGFHPLMREWLLIEDPDLEELRRKDRFIRFERETYPHAVPDRHRPRRPLWAEVMAYDQRLLRGTARVMEETWCLRKERLPAETHVLAQWFSGEGELWECVHRVARNQGCDWRDREKLLQTVRAIADPVLLTRCGLPSTLPELDELLDEAAWIEPGEAEGRVEVFDKLIVRRLQILSCALQQRSVDSAAASPVSRSVQWLAAVRQDFASVGSVSPGAVRQACWDYEATWRALSEQLDPDGDKLALPRALRRLREPRGARGGPALV
ncbi:hypothetical protein WEB32_31735 [Streptomyces netropsis]|uniref:Tetratricopeptide (TPR) repeat protein n=1 Tax=Streptomyces netropsis TaxID=55404 RepID=A0A7W7L8A9_STRNE|nr:hypothetical protein [Streptomyces netropsis]MBB4885314.1 tetratricopeptide (TPR) repeat protein [Streptomyces netropsis]